MIKAIKSFYRANIYKPTKSIRPGSFPEGCFMKESPLAKKATGKKISFSEYIANGWENLIYRIGSAMDDLVWKHK